VANQKAEANLGVMVDTVYALVEIRKRERPAGSYTTYLFDQGLDKILKKVGEESCGNDHRSQERRFRCSGSRDF